MSYYKEIKNNASTLLVGLFDLIQHNLRKRLLTVMNTKGNSGIFYQVGYFEYHKYGSVGYGMLSIKGQFDFITLKIYSKNSFNKAYEQIFGD